jgi:hypothetical protein
LTIFRIDIADDKEDDSEGMIKVFEKAGDHNNDIAPEPLQGSFQ